MKIIRIFNRGVKDGFKSIFRNFSLSLASISSAAITLIIVAIAIVFTYNVNSITKNIENVLTVIVFVDRGTSEDDINILKDKIIANENVLTSSLEYKSPDDLKEQLSANEDLKNVLNTLDENPLQATFVFKVRDVKKISETANNMKTYEHVSQVKFGESLASKLVSMLEIVRNACVITVVALIFVTIFLISNTIKITIFSRRQEISIMRLVGTSNTVIKLPFLVEGLILGIIGSIIPVLLTVFGYTFLYDYVGGDLFSQLIVLVPPNQIIYLTSLVLIIVGGLVGMFGSLNAVRRYLKI
ncbi:MAG: permease-like cell division protein FtsX [Bacilli bacterium]|nr:permease-like cell division protein FtsX [Bacilli bacterium]